MGRGWLEGRRRVLARTKDCVAALVPAPGRYERCGRCCWSGIIRKGGRMQVRRERGGEEGAGEARWKEW